MTIQDIKNEIIFKQMFLEMYKSLQNSTPRTELMFIVYGKSIQRILCDIIGLQTQLAGNITMGIVAKRAIVLIPERAESLNSY